MMPSIPLRAPAASSRCSSSAPESASTASITVEVAASVSRSSLHASTTSDASCHWAASPSSRADGSSPSRSAWSDTRDAA